MDAKSLTVVVAKTRLSVTRKAALHFQCPL